MKTITGINSLILAKNTLNKSNIFNIDKLFFKENYFNVFNNIYNEFKNIKIYPSFIEKWHEVCKQECDNLTKKLKKLIANRKLTALTNDDKAMIERIVVKFRGNLGEIFAEAFFTEGYLANICKSNIYNPVDPHHEEYIDAESISAVDGLTIGIQIKNYSNINISIEIFDKASTSYLDALSKYNDSNENLLFQSQPRIIIFSFTDITNELILNKHSKRIMFIGPKDIDSKNLQGNYKKNIPANWLFFKTIADEIMSVNK